MGQKMQFLFLLAWLLHAVESFVPPRPVVRFHNRVLFGSNFLKQKPGESDMEFFKRIQQAASDPEAFEKMALGKDDDDDIQKKTASEKKKKKGGYQRAEEWDAEVKARQKSGEYTWEERVQFEGQRQGNQFNQNEILRKNLRGF